MTNQAYHESISALQQKIEREGFRLNELTNNAVAAGTYINSLKTELAELKIALESQQEQMPRFERWKPQKDEAFWYIEITGLIAEEVWDGYDSLHWALYDAWNCFPSLAAAQKENARRQARTKLEWLSERLRAFTPHVKNTDYYFIDYQEDNHREKRFYTINDLIRPRLGTFSFHSRKDADYALAQMTDTELEGLKS